MGIYRDRPCITTGNLLWVVSRDVRMSAAAGAAAGAAGGAAGAAAAAATGAESAGAALAAAGTAAGAAATTTTTTTTAAGAAAGAAAAAAGGSSSSSGGSSEPSAPCRLQPVCKTNLDVASALRPIDRAKRRKLSIGTWFKQINRLCYQRQGDNKRRWHRSTKAAPTVHHRSTATSASDAAASLLHPEKFFQC